MEYLRYAAYQIHQLPIATIIIYLLVVNAITFLAYWKDKRAAINKTWRVAEAMLHSLMFAGGTAGALAGQKILRHKTRKRSFQMKFWLLLILQLGCIAYITFAF